MPRYLIHTNDEIFHCRDDTGFNFPDANVARAQALKVLPEMALHILDRRDRHLFTVEVEDEEGRVIYEGKLKSLADGKLIPSSNPSHNASTTEAALANRLGLRLAIAVDRRKRD